MSVLLNFGCGPDVRDGWSNIDRDCYPGAQYADPVRERLPYFNETFDGIVANHVINMITFHDVRIVLRELRRVLRPGGTLRILVPDYEWAIAHPDQVPVSSALESTLDGRLLRYLFWHGQAGSCFTADSLAATLLDAGFTTVQRCKFAETESDHPKLITLDSREQESLIMEATR